MNQKAWNASSQYCNVIPLRRVEHAGLMAILLYLMLGILTGYMVQWCLTITQQFIG
jgi:hypothetical protein